jgi:hypothetical protein
MAAEDGRRCQRVVFQAEAFVVLEHRAHRRNLRAQGRWISDFRTSVPADKMSALRMAGRDEVDGMKSRVLCLAVG